MFASPSRLDFAVVGVQKAGTTALFHFLSQHSRIAMPGEKELHFFDDDSRCWVRPDYRDYLSRFPRRRGAIRGEATPSYIWWPNALERLRSHNPDVRIIALFRDPVARAHAHWRMSRARGREHLDFSSAIRGGRGRLATDTADDVPRRHYSYVERGFYGAQVERLLSIFPRSQILMLRHDDLAQHHADTLARVFDFLGLEWEYVPPGRVFDGAPDLPVSAADEAFLADTYAADLERFSELSRLDVSHWSCADPNRRVIAPAGCQTSRRGSLGGVTSIMPFSSGLP